MQFKNIGEILTATKVGGVDAYTAAANIVKGMDATVQGSLLNITKLTKGEKLAALALNDIYGDAALAALSIEKTGEAAERSASLFTSLGNAIKGFVVSNQLLTVFLAGAAALFAVNALVDKFTTTFDESFEAAQKSAEEYNNTVSEISSLNSELETTNARIDELNAKEHLSFVEQSELNKLYATREQLEKVIALKEKQAEAQGKDSAEDSKTTLEKKDFNVRSKDNQGNYVKDANGNYVYEKGTVLEDALDTMDKLNSAQEKLNKLKEEGADEDSSEYKFASENVDTLTAHLTENMDKINELSTHLYNTETGEALKGYEDLARGVNDVIDVYLDFSDTGSSIDHKIENIFAKAKFKDVKDSLVEAGKEGSNALNNMISSTPGLTDALNAAGVSAQQLSEYIMALADPEALNLDIIKKQLKDIYSSDNYKLNLKAGEKASKEFDEFLNKKKPEEIEIFYRYVKQNDLDISGWTLEDLQYNFDKAVNNEAVSSIDSLTDSSNEFLASVNAVNEALSAQSTGESIDSETYNSEELKTYASALEYVNGSMQLNAEKVRELTKAKAEEKIAILEASKANDINEYNENAAKIAFYMSNLKNLTGAERAELNSLQSRNSIIAANSIQYDIMTASIREATGAYKEWLNAQNTPESGDMADDARSAMEKISEVFDSSSKEYGRVGTTKYQAAVDFVVPDEVSAEGDKAVREYVKNLQTYFTEDKSGSDKFIQEALDKGLMEYDPDTGATKVAANKTMEDFAKSFNWTDETTKAIFGELQEYGWDFDWSDEGIKNYDEALFACNETAATLQSRIDELNGKKVKTEADLTELEQLKKELAEIEAEKQRINSTKLNTFADLSSELGEAKRELSALYEKKDRHLPVDDSEIENAKQKVTDLESEINELGSAPTKVQIEAEVELVDKQLEEKKQELNKAQIRQTVTAETDTSGLQNEVAKLEQQKRNLEYTLTVVPDTDEAESKLNELNNTEFNPKSITVDVIGDAQTKLNSIKSALALLPTEKEISITTTYTQNGTPPQTGDQTVNGTANANGNFNATAWASSYTGLAYANGNWASQKSGTTLIGELGREIVVNPNTGKWRTYGDNGAEFISLPAGAIVFNHKQTEALLERGHVAGRGAAHVNGNFGKALVSGQKNASDVFSNNYSGGVQDANTASTTANTKAKDENTKKTEESTSVFDGVERRLKYFAAKTQAIADSITDYVTSAFKTMQLKRQIKATKNEVTVNEKGYARYIKKANSVGLSPAWKNRVQKGDYRINDIKDEKLAEKISAYQDWYDKAQDCKQAVQDLKNTQLELFEQWLNMPTEKAEKAIEKLSKKYNILNAQISTITSGGSTTAQLQKLQSASYASAQSNLEKAQDKKAEAKAKSQKAKSKFNSAKSTLKKSKLTKAEKKAVKSNKKVNTKGLSGTKKKRVEAYNAALTQKKKATSNYSSAKSDYTTASSYAGALRSSLSGSTSYEVANSLIDEQLNNQRKQDAEYQKALKDSQKNVTDTKATRDSANTKVKNKGSSISKKYSKKLSKAQKDALASGKTVSLKGITDKKLKKQLEEYNKLVTQSKTATTQYNMALDAQSTAAENAATSQAELAQALVDADVAKLENISNFYDAQKSYTDAQASAKQSAIDLKQAKGEKVTEADYRAQMGYNNQNINTLLQKKQKLEAQLANSSTIKPNSEEWYKIKAEIEGVAQEINNCEINNEELKDSIRNAKYKEMFENALEAVDKFKTALSTVRDLINEDMMYDDNGGLTEYGLTALATYVKDLESSESKIQTLLAERRQLDADLKNAASGLSEDEYKEAVKSNEESLQNELKSMNSSRQAILSIMKEQAKAELDAINEVINARKEALQKKKEYYDYDKTLKSKTREIQLLKQQIAALDGMTDAESRAKKARLEAQLAEKNDDLNDTVREHVYQLEVDGLTDLTKELQENYDDYVKELGRTLESIEKAVGNATNTVVGALGDVSSTVAAILKSYGINDPKSIGITSNLTGAANGGYVKGIIPAGDDGLAGVRIGEEVVVPEVVQELRKMLPTLQRSSELMFADSVKVDLQSLKAASNSGIGDINLHYDAMVSIGQIDGSSKDIVAQIEKAMPNISKRVINDLRKDARKKGLK